MTESSFDALTVKRASLAIFILVPGAGIALYLYVWGWSSFWSEFQQGILLLVFLASIPVHELLHYCGFVFLNGVERKYVDFRFNRKSMTPYVVCRVNTSVMRYKVAALLPFLLLGISPAVYGLFVHNSTILAAGLLNIAGCAGDVILYFLLLRLDNRSIVSRHAQRIGFVVVGS